MNPVTGHGSRVTINGILLRFIAALLLTLLPLSAGATPKSAYTWNRMAEGLFYATYSFAVSETERTTVSAFEIDPARYRLDVVTATDEVLGATAAEMAQQAGALLVVNGGFFTPEHRSIGLLVKGGKRLTPLHTTSWWSVFAIRGGKPGIVALKDFREGSDISMAVQAGPRLAVDGTIPKLKESVARRSAIGITREGMIIIAVTTGSGISMQELAKRMSASRFEGGLECKNAMALDGGSSSQLYAKIGDFELSLGGLARVTSGIGVFGK